MAASVAVLPPTPIGPSQHATIFPPNPHIPDISPGPQHRPKLSLDTSVQQQRPLGRGNTGLRLDTLSAISPTVKNTYRNTYGVTSAPATPFQVVEQSSLTLSTQRFGSQNNSPKPPTPHPLQASGVSSSESPPSSPSSSSDTSDVPRVPYTPSSGLRSILSNSPLPKQERHRVSAARSFPSRQGTSKRRFTQPRRVLFRDTNLTEDILTSKYTATHYEITLEEDNRGEVASADGRESRGSGSPRTGDKRDSPSDDDDAEAEESTNDEDEDQDASYPKTPIAGRRKKRREWVWTLGPPRGQEHGEPEGIQEDSCPNFLGMSTRMDTDL